MSELGRDSSVPVGYPDEHLKAKKSPRAMKPALRITAVGSPTSKRASTAGFAALLRFSLVSIFSVVGVACWQNDQQELGRSMSEPREIIDLGALVTEDLPERVWGKALLDTLGYTRSNAFDVIEWEFEVDGGSIFGSNAYYTLFNHGGPHLDAPNHIGIGEGLDKYPVEAFVGPVRVFDVHDLPKGRSIPPEVFKGSVSPGNVVLIFTGYTPPGTDDVIPETITLTPAAAAYLAKIPVRAFGTDALSVESLQDTSRVDGLTAEARGVPIHHAFLSRGIPIYEQLFNVDELLDKEDMYFIGVPLKVRGGDGMIVRPVVLVY